MNKEFLLNLYKACEMGSTSIKDVIGIISNKENKITKNLIDYENQYIVLKDRVEHILKENNITYGGGSLMAKAGSFMGVHMELMRDNSDAKIADMLIQGFTMGVLEVTRELKKNKERITKEEKAIAEDLISFQNKAIKEMKHFL